MSNEREMRGEDSVKRPCSALDATSMSSNGKYLVELGEAMQHGASDVARQQGRLRASMNVVARELRDAAERWKRTAETIRYDEHRNMRHALDVHVNLMRDLAMELDHPGQTKYAPKRWLTDGSANNL